MSSFAALDKLKETAPWQLRWKRPQWHSVVPSNKRNDVLPTPGGGTLVSHTAARVAVSELLDHWSVSASSEKHQDEVSTLPQSLMLTVSILNRSEDPTSSSRSQIGDVVNVDILKQSDASLDNQDSDSYRCLETQTLHWPSVQQHLGERPRTDLTLSRRDDPCATLFGNANPLLQLLGWVKPVPERSALQLMSEDEDDDLPSDDISCFSGLSAKPSGSRTLTNPVKPRISSGIVAVSLVRRPNEKRDAPTSDALDVLKLMSLDTGGSKDEAVGVVQSSVPESDATLEMEKPSSATASDADAKASSCPRDLLLACLTSDGKILFYSPWKLLNSQRDPKSNKIEDGMSSFWFGSQMLDTVQKNVLPLSDPEHAVPLSIPFLRRGGNQWTEHHWSSISETRDTSRFAVPESVDADDVFPVLPSANVPAQEKSNPSTKHPFLPAMFNGSVWDPTLDLSSLCYQTVDNVPTHCVTVHDYVCIGGHGRRRWKPSSDVDVENGMGGFVTFVALRTMSEKRTVFLPFAPTHLSPLIWGEMSLLFVSGHGHAAVIRTDGSSTVPAIPLRSRDAPSKISKSKSDSSKNADSKKALSVLVQRFQILPIQLPNANRSLIHATVIGCDVTTSPPVLAVLFHDSSSSEGTYVDRRSLISLDAAPRHHGDSSVFSEYLKTQESSVLVTTAAANALPATWIPISISHRKELWCRLGQGWCAIGSGRQSYIICYEGSNSERGAFVQKMNVKSDESMIFSNCFESSILALNPYDISPVSVGRHDVSTLFSEPVAASRIRASDHRKVESSDIMENVDDIVLEAMESISTLNFRGSFGSNSPPGSRRNRPSSFSTREKSQRLLRHCSSWTKLDQSSFSKSFFEYQSPVINLRSRENEICVLSLRTAALDCGPAAPFQQVLAWLSEQQDFFTASSLAFDLLRDVESLRHLWRSFDKIENENELSKLEGLLDGVIPINLEDADSMDDKTSQTVVQLADMTVACLIKGGYAMSSTLEQFLSGNTFYDPSRASLMLAASVAGTLSDDESHVSAVMGHGYVPGKNHLDCLLWPIRCLLKMGVTRDRLGTVLLLLNTTIPDEMRRRDRMGVPLTTTSSLDLCKAIVTLIVTASIDGPELLRDLVDERSRVRFWDSLEHETKVELCVVEFSGSYRLLRDQEIRSWILVELQKSVESEDRASAANIYDVSPTRWLQTLVLGCLLNAGCNLPSLLSPIHDETKEDLGSNSDLARYRDDIKNARAALTASRNTGGLDHDILIPALLLLEHRNALWHESSSTCTRTVLNAACYHAGRGGEEDPLFPMNSSTLMRQCTRLGDVEAGGHLVGGKNGLILLCCLTLIDELTMNMNDAERFVLGDFSVVGESIPSASSRFSIQECHLRLLWLLEEHVLKIRTYGEFTESRGKVEPVFAATAIFRTWWALTKHSSMLSDATKWLIDWLRQELRLPLVDNAVMSPYRLVCAALVQALVWPQRSDIVTNAFDSVTTPLANMLEIDGIFLIQLAQSCCGMVEAVPASMTDAEQRGWDHADATFTLPSPTKRNTSMSSVGDMTLSPPRTNTIDESFMSAAASYRDLDTSQISWYTK